MAFKDLSRRTGSDKVLHDKSFNITKTSKHDGSHCGIASVVYKFFDRKSSGSGVKNEIMVRQELAKQLHKPFIRNFKKRKAHSSFIDNIWDNILADVQLENKFNKRF